MNDADKESQLLKSALRFVFYYNNNHAYQIRVNEEMQKNIWSSYFEGRPAITYIQILPAYSPVFARFYRKMRMPKNFRWAGYKQPPGFFQEFLERCYKEGNAEYNRLLLLQPAGSNSSYLTSQQLQHFQSAQAQKNAIVRNRIYQRALASIEQKIDAGKDVPVPTPATDKANKMHPESRQTHEQIMAADKKPAIPTIQTKKFAVLPQPEQASPTPATDKANKMHPEALETKKPQADAMPIATSEWLAHFHSESPSFSEPAKDSNENSPEYSAEGSPEHSPQSSYEMPLDTPQAAEAPEDQSTQTSYPKRAAIHLPKLPRRPGGYGSFINNPLNFTQSKVKWLVSGTMIGILVLSVLVYALSGIHIDTPPVTIPSPGIPGPGGPGAPPMPGPTTSPLPPGSSANQTRQAIIDKFGVTMNGFGHRPDLLLWAYNKLSAVSGTNLINLVRGTIITGVTTGSAQTGCNAIDLRTSIESEELLGVLLIHELGHIVRNCAQARWGDHMSALANEGAITHYARTSCKARASEWEISSEDYAEMIAYYLNPSAGEQTACGSGPNPFSGGRFPQHRQVAEQILLKP